MNETTILTRNPFTKNNKFAKHVRSPIQFLIQSKHSLVISVVKGSPTNFSDLHKVQLLKWLIFVFDKFQISQKPR